MASSFGKVPYDGSYQSNWQTLGVAIQVEWCGFKGHRGESFNVKVYVCSIVEIRRSKDDVMYKMQFAVTEILIVLDRFLTTVPPMPILMIFIYNKMYVYKMHVMSCYSFKDSHYSHMKCMCMCGGMGRVGSQISPHQQLRRSKEMFALSNINISGNKANVLSRYWYHIF